MFRTSYQRNPVGVNVRLFGRPGCEDALLPREASATVRRWQTVAIALACLNAKGVSSPSAFEDRLLKERQLPPGERPKLLSRMLKHGEPAMGKSDGLSAVVQFWLGDLFESTGLPGTVLREPLWKLLDPAAISFAELQDVSHWVLSQGGPPMLPYPFERISEAERVRCLVGAMLSDRFSDRLALTAALLELRRAEVFGDLPAFDSSLQALSDICFTRSEDCIVAALQGTRTQVMDLREFLLRTFSTVVLNHVASTHLGTFRDFVAERGLTELDTYTPVPESGTSRENPQAQDGSDSPSLA